MYFPSSLYLPTLLVLFYFVFFSLSLSPPPLPCLPAPPPLLILPFTVYFFFTLSFSSISILALFLSLSLLSPLYSTLSLFGNAALLLALLFPIYASLLKCPFFFLPFSPALIGPFPSRLLFFPGSSPSLHSLFPYSFVLFYVFYAPSPALSSSWVTFPLPFPSFPSNHPFFPPVLPFLTPSYHSFFSCPTCHLRPL